MAVSTGKMSDRPSRGLAASCAVWSSVCRRATAEGALGSVREAAARAEVARAELVGLVPRAVLEAVPTERWSELDLGAERTIEARLDLAG